MTSADTYQLAARAQFDEGNFTEAVELARQGLALDPDHVDLLQVSGLAHFELGEWPDALANLETASALAVLSPLAQLALAAIYASKIGKLQTALAMYEFLAEPARCPTPLLPEVARGFGGLGAYAQAFGVCLRLIGLRPTFHPAQFGAAYYLVQMNASAPQVLPYIRQAFELAPDNLSYRISLAMLCARTDEPAEAYELLRSVPPETVRCADCVRRAYAVLIQVGDERLAAAWHSRALALTSSGTESPGAQTPE